MDELQRGSLLQGGRCYIEDVLGQGGFGITYRATIKGAISGNLGTIEVNVPVAIKEFFMKDLCARDTKTSHVSVLSAGLENQLQRYRNKFIKEALKIAGLSHPHIVKVLDVFEENGTVYYAMQYLEGGSLSDRMKQGPMAEADAVRYIRQIAGALGYMHQTKQLCHYDVKPGNILIDKQSNNAKLIDFGISKGYDGQGSETSSTPVGLTHGYAPIEQSNNALQDFSPQTDIYSLGATLLALLTGQTPPEAAYAGEYGIGEKPDFISVTTWQAICAAMKPFRKDRPQSTDEFLQLLGNEETMKIYQPVDNSTTPIISPPNSETTRRVQGQVPVQAKVQETAEGDIIVSINNISFRMIRVEGGTFSMGANRWLSDEKPVHHVTLSNYYMGETEVTQELWEAVMGNNPSQFKGARRPVECVSWEDCQNFILRLNQFTGKTFRLPTEAEWEFAARGGNKAYGYKYTGSNNIEDVAWYIANSDDITHNVAMKQPNELGLYDMSGNVYEWCQDWYDNYQPFPQTNPTGPSLGHNRIIRGGSWGSGSSYCRVTYRDYNSPISQKNYLSLRLAL